MEVYKCAGKKNKYIVTLLIPSNAQTNLNRQNIVNAEYAKYRCSQALVVNIEHKITHKLCPTTVCSNKDPNFFYTINQTVQVDDYDESEEICTTGIHFFKTKEQAHFYGSHINGLNKRWYANGQLGLEYTYLNKKLHGEHKRWYDNGYLNKQCHYLNGVLDGKYQKWDKNGILRKECFYVDNKQHGLCREWNSVTLVETNVNYENGKKHGIFNSHRNGLKIQITFNHDKKMGEWWYCVDQLYREIMFVDDKIICVKYWNKDGTLKSKLEYENE